MTEALPAMVEAPPVVGVVPAAPVEAAVVEVEVAGGSPMAQKEGRRSTTSPAWTPGVRRSVQGPVRGGVLHCFTSVQKYEALPATSTYVDL